MRGSAIRQEREQKINGKHGLSRAWSPAHDDDMLSTVVYASCNGGSNLLKDNQLFIEQYPWTSAGNRLSYVVHQFAAGPVLALFNSSQNWLPFPASSLLLR